MVRKLAVLACPLLVAVPMLFSAADAVSTEITTPLVITSTKFGPMTLGMSVRAAKDTGMFRAATQPEKECGLALRLKRPWNRSMSADVLAGKRLKHIEVSGPGSAQVARTRHGIKVGSTVAALRAAEDVTRPKRVDGTQTVAYYLGAAGHWVSFLVNNSGAPGAPVVQTSKVTSIVVATTKVVPSPLPSTGC